MGHKCMRIIKNPHCIMIVANTLIFFYKKLQLASFNINLLGSTLYSESITLVSNTQKVIFNHEGKNGHAHIMWDRNNKQGNNESSIKMTPLFK